MTAARTSPAAPAALVLLVLLVLLGAAPPDLAQAAPEAGGGAPGGTARATPSPGGVPPPAAPERWGRPLPGEPAVVRGFAAPARRWSPGHRGVDLASEPGAPVLSPAAGRVVLARRVVDRGVVVLEHAGGLRTTLEPVEGAPPVGTPVARGDAVGRLAAQGWHCPGCLHWGVRRGEGRSAVYLDPLSLLAPPDPPVLLPLPPRLTAG